MYVSIVIFNVIFFININKIVIVYFTLLSLQLIHIFFYFQTIYQYSKYTSTTKFFWIRVFSIFWGLEFYLFIIVIFLFIIAPAELPIFWELRQIKLDKRIPSISTTNNYLITLITIFNVNVIGYCIVYKNKIYSLLSALLSIFILLCIFLKELESYYYFNLMFYYKKTSPIKELKLNSLITLSNEKIPNISLNDVITNKNTSNFLITELFSYQFTDDIDHHKARFFILNVMLSIKFIHVYIIVILNLIFMVHLINIRKQTSLETLGVWQQNLIVLLIFWLLNYIIYFKVFYKTKMYGFYTNISTYDLLQNWSFIFEEFYFI